MWKCKRFFTGVHTDRLQTGTFIKKITCYALVGSVLLPVVTACGKSMLPGNLGLLDVSEVQVNSESRVNTETPVNTETWVNTEPPAKQEEVVLSFVGDIMLSRGVQQYLDENGYQYPYEEVQQVFLQDDFTIGNLECPITEYEFGANKEKRFVFRGDTENAKALKDAGFDCLNLANNHSMDYLSNGLGETIEHLTGEDIIVVGAGMDASCPNGCILEKNGMRIGILAFSIFPSEGFFYNANEPTVSYVSDYNLEDIREKIETLDATFKIVYFHWGVEYRPYHSEMQERYAHFAIDSGADFVVGAHPHVLQDVEYYKDKPIYYSLGNFVFDKQIQEGTDKTVILQLHLENNEIKDLVELPATIERGRVRMQHGT